MSLVRLLDTLAPESWRNPFSIFGTAVAADAWLASDTSAFANTYIESRDTAGAYVFSAALPPGVKKEEVRVEVDEGNVLVITGERSVRREERSDRWHHIERSCATFLGRFHLPGDAAVDGRMKLSPQQVDTYKLQEKESKSLHKLPHKRSAGHKSEFGSNQGHL